MRNLLITALALLASHASARTDHQVVAYQTCKFETQALAWHFERGETLQGVTAVAGHSWKIETWAAPSGEWTKVVLRADGVRCWAAFGNSTLPSVGDLTTTEAWE